MKVSPRGDRRRITKLEEEDGGTFVCEAENEGGVDVRNIYLKVLGQSK